MERNRGIARATVAIVAGLALLVTGCAGGLHHAGEHQLAVTGCFGHPFDPSGRADNADVTVGYSYFVRDRFPRGRSFPVRLETPRLRGRGAISAGVNRTVVALPIPRRTTYWMCASFIFLSTRSAEI